MVAYNMGTVHGTGREPGAYPKSIRHKQILDIAADRPDASIEAIADNVPSATVDLVENVLEEYGDPASNGTGDPATAAEEPSTSPEPTEADDQQPVESVAEPEDRHNRVDLSSVSDRQREVLTAIHARPQATQREIGEQLAVSAATVNKSVNAIRGFEWTNRDEIVADLFGATSREPAEMNTMATNDQTSTTDVDRLSDRISSIEQHLDATPEQGSGDRGLDDPELLHKVLRACFESDDISEAEEREVLETLIR